MKLNQKTIGRAGSFSGIGVHTGQQATVHLKPAAVGTGVRFLKNGKAIDVSSGEPASDLSQEAKRCNWVGRGPDQILTVEHFLSALTGLGICNILIDVVGSEMPILDGCSASYTETLAGLGIIDQKTAAEVYKIKEPLFVSCGNSALCVTPADRLSFHYVLDYRFPFLSHQLASFVYDSDDYRSQIAPARTFCTEQEARQLLQSGYGMGANRQNTLVVRADGSHVPELKFENECARHKILDLIGDLTLAGFWVCGKVIGLRSGHALNRKLTYQIRIQKG